MNLRDQDRIKRDANRLVYEEGTFVYVVNQTISSGSDYDTYNEEETITEIRYKVPAFISWEPKTRYAGVGDGVIYGKVAQVTLWGIPNDFLSLFTENKVIEVPNDTQSSYNQCRVISISPDPTNVVFTVYLEKR
jgi:hypothetical protein